MNTIAPTLPVIKPASDKWAYPDLKADFKAGENAWREVSSEFADDALNVLPPIYFTGGFLVSEPYTHDPKTGCGVYACFAEIGRRHFARYATRAEAPALVADLRISIAKQNA
jgi:hypothetical protein